MCNSERRKNEWLKNHRPSSDRALHSNPEFSTRRGAWVAQLVKHPTLDFGSGHNLMVLTDREEPAWDSVSPCLSAPPPLSLSK